MAKIKVTAKKIKARKGCTSGVRLTFEKPVSRAAMEKALSQAKDKLPPRKSTVQPAKHTMRRVRFSARQRNHRWSVILSDMRGHTI